MEKRYPLLIIEWHDSALARSQWHYEDDIEDIGVGKCISVGFLIKTTKEAKYLAANMAAADKEHKQWAGIIAIPTACIVKEKRITSFSCPAFA